MPHLQYKADCGSLQVKEISFQDVHIQKRDLRDVWQEVFLKQVVHRHHRVRVALNPIQARPPQMHERDMQDDCWCTTNVTRNVWVQLRALSHSQCVRNGGSPGNRPSGSVHAHTSMLASHLRLIALMGGRARATKNAPPLCRTWPWRRE